MELNIHRTQCITYGKDIGYQPVFNRPFIHARETRRGYFERPRVLWLLTLVPTGRVCSRGKLTAIYGPLHTTVSGNWQHSPILPSLDNQCTEAYKILTYKRYVSIYSLSLLFLTKFSLNYEKFGKKTFVIKQNYFGRHFNPQKYLQMNLGVASTFSQLGFVEENSGTSPVRLS